MNLQRAEDDQAYKELQSHVESLDKALEESVEIKRRLEQERTKIGVGEDNKPRLFFKIIETFIDQITATIGQAQNQLKQAHICIGYIKGFDVKYAKLIKENKEQNATIDALEERIRDLEQEREDREAVKVWFSTKAKLITLASSTIIGVGVIGSFIAGLWGD